MLAEHPLILQKQELQTSQALLMWYCHGCSVCCLTQNDPNFLRSDDCQGCSVPLRITCNGSLLKMCVIQVCIEETVRWFFSPQANILLKTF